VLYSCRRCWPAAAAARALAAARPLHCTSALHRTHHPPRLALLPRQAVLLVQTRQTAPARTHAFHGRRTGPARANRWSEAAHPPGHRFSFCPNATAARLSLLPTKRPHQIPPTPSPPRLCSPFSRPRTKTFAPLPTATAAASSPFPPAFALLLVSSV
jgi:hypothetical protein